MLSKSQLRFIKSLHLKKFRTQHQQFLVEGEKSVTEFVSAGFQLSHLFYLPELASKVANFPQKRKHYAISSQELSKITSLKSSAGILAVFSIPQQKDLQEINFEEKFTLVLDNIQDPGNLGTIIRTADWFGIQYIVCSPNTASCYNPKVVQATMGSLSRVQLLYAPLAPWLEQNRHIKTYAALLDGKSLYELDLGLSGQSGGARQGLIVLGNEGHGIDPSLLKWVDQSFTIPRFGEAESLNVAIAAALICSEIRRNESLQKR